ncbi:MAG: pirin family protein [Deltaproteobacteria bacterium]|nr:pirin family protein [Deltaproteobacteria bacterium]
MLKVLQAGDRFHSQIGWLDSWHTFSFGEHHDPKREGFRNLRVINEDRVTAGAGFGTHGHRDMEILSYVIDGALGHSDSMGNGGTIVPGDVQRMSAGTGVQHSEKNHAKDRPVHFLQIWLLPSARGIAPGYAQKMFDVESKRDTLRLVASSDGRQGSISIHSDVDLYASMLSEGKQVKATLGRSGHGWVQVIKGVVDVNGTVLQAGDGAAAIDERTLTITSRAESELLVFDLI